MAFIDSIYRKAKANPTRVAIPEATNPRMMRAAAAAASEGLAQVVFVGDARAIEKTARDEGLALADTSVVDTGDDEVRADLANKYDVLLDKPMPTKFVARRLSEPLMAAMVLEKVGEADCTFAGLDATTYEFLLAANGVIGLAEGTVTASGLLLLEFDDFDGEQGQLFGFADGAVCAEPTAEQLASIATSCCDTFSTLTGEEARCAFLSYSTDGSGTSPSVDRMREGVRLAQQVRPDLKIDGEFQSDAALLPRVARKKVKRSSEVAGRANVLVFGDAAACNAGTKLLQIFAGAKSYGPVYQGFKLPVLDCSRSDTEERLYDNIAICSVYGQQRGGRA